MKKGITAFAGHIAFLTIVVLAVIMTSGCGGNGDSIVGTPTDPAPESGPTPEPGPAPEPGSEPESPILIRAITPPAAGEGDTVVISFSGTEDPAIVWSGSTIDGMTVPGSPGSISFVVPAGAESGPISLKKGSLTSNHVWFSISSASVITPSGEDIVIDEQGNSIAVNQVLICLKDSSNSIAEAERVALLVGGKIVGQIPLMAGYQIQLDATTMDELDADIAILVSDAAVDFVVKNIISADDAIDWSGDADFQNQRDNNMVEEGADLYEDNVHPTLAGKIRPLFTSIGIVEDDVDFDEADFSSYTAKGLGRFNNIGLYAKDGDIVSDEHGSVVSGIIAAEMGNAGMAGLLQSVSGAHGGFNIMVENSGGWLFSQFATTQRMLEAGVRVVNWSFGFHKKGAPTSRGTDVDNNVLAAALFDMFHKSATKLVRQVEKHYPQVTIVATAGNGDTNAGDADFRSPSSIVSDNLIVVGAHSADDAPVRDYGWSTISSDPYSNYGDRVDIVAAGRVIGCDGTDFHSGTSYAAPLVTATIGAMLSIEPDLMPIEIKRILRSSALPLENDVSMSDGSKDVFTAPLTTAEVGSDAARIGKGARLNVHGAIQAAIDARMNRTIPEGDPLSVDLTFGLSSDVTEKVTITLPDGTIYDKVDVVFLVDVSGSYGDDLAQFKNQATAIVNTFKSGGANVRIGIASFSDFPISPFGWTGGDYAYRLDCALTADTDAVIAAINSLTILNGNDGPESQLEALYQVAGGLGRTVDGYPDAAIAPSSMGWREGALPVIFLATDASFHDSDSETTYPGAGWTQTVNYLNSKKIRVYGLQAGGTISDVTDIVDATGGQQFTLSSNSSEIVSAVESALESASAGVRVELRKNGDFAKLITNIEPEFYEGANPGDTLSFDVTFSRKFFGDDTGEHVFSLRLDIIAEDVATIMVVPVTVNVK